MGLAVVKQPSPGTVSLNTLEANLRPELNLPWVKIASSRSESRDVYLVVAGIAGQREVGPVEQVKALDTELEIDSLSDLEVLEKRHVHVEVVWPNKRVPA